MEDHLTAATAEEVVVEVVMVVEEVVHPTAAAAVEEPLGVHHPVQLAVVAAVVGAVDLAVVAWSKMDYVVKWICWPKMLVNIPKDVISGTLRTPIR